MTTKEAKHRTTNQLKKERKKCSGGGQPRQPIPKRSGAQNGSRERKKITESGTGSRQRKKGFPSRPRSSPGPGGAEMKLDNGRPNNQKEKVKKAIHSGGVVRRQPQGGGLTLVNDGREHEAN